MANIRGTLGNDKINGTDSADSIYADDGNDIVFAGAGKDSIDGGNGDDRLYGEAGNDDLYGYLGNDYLNGSDGNDNLYGEAGNDTMLGGAGGDNLYGGVGNDSLLGSYGNDYLSGGSGDDIVRGESDNDYLDGLDGNDSLDGGDGNDTLIGYYGEDTLNGSSGTDNLRGEADDDTYVVDSMGDVVTEAVNEGTDTVQSEVSYTLGVNLEHLTLIGTGAINGTGNSLNNTLTGNAANNTLNGGAGVDTLVGGTGDDTYIVDSTTDIILEVANEGTDNIQSKVTFTLGENLENLTLTGTSAINGTGNSLNNTITGNSAVNTLAGGNGNDIYIVDSTTDTIVEYFDQGTDTIQSSRSYTLGANKENLTLTGTSAINGIGNSLNNTITGNAAKNTLSGGVGINTLLGGAGNDTYIVDFPTDTILEAGNEGTDTVQSSVSFTLGDNLENLTLTGTNASNGTGNSLNNTLTGNSAVNTLAGGNGNDIYIVDSSSDTIIEYSDQGTDTIQSSLSYTLGANLENLTLRGTSAMEGIGNALDNTISGNATNNSLLGSEGNDVLYGQAGNDRLNGGLGIDSLVGATGNDTYIVDSITDTITENSNEGVDTVQSSVSFVLGGHLENLMLTEFGNISGTGNAFNNTLTGNTANNSLFGGDGNDALHGQAGRDTLTGAAGADQFTFSSPTEGTDTIADFNRSQGDKLLISVSGFGGGLPIGTLPSSLFTVGESAADAGDRFIYNSATGQLFFDFDGIGRFDQTQIASLWNLPFLVSSDIIVFA